jgi:two-component system CheB/CheR fusion protein
MKKQPGRGRKGKAVRGAKPEISGDAPQIVIGIGAAAGGLVPLQRLLSELPLRRGLAAVVVEHLDAGSDALLVSLIAERTRFEVVEAADGAAVLADHVYVMPAGKSLSIIDGKLSMQDVSPCAGLRMPIDHFLCTLAADLGRRAVGVLLSGTGIDGTHGLAEIKALGGATAVQDPVGAEFPEMPRNALAAGHADAVLSPEAIAVLLVERLEALAALTAEQLERAALESILAAVRNATGHDFHCYKAGTLERRIRRRMGLRRVETYDDYARSLRGDRDEAAALRKDLLIGVTEFFRQADAWRVLEEKAVAELVAGAKAQSTLRVWVPACATGKEAYSLAILLAETVERSGKKLGLQIFATDADATAVDQARAGVYAEGDLKGISAARLRRFFARKNGRYEVVKPLREMIVFAPQDLTSDPPFSKLDLVSCRNLLIYLDQSVQKKIIQLFHFALREGGCLFLGSAENISGQDNLFAPLSQKWRIYRKLGVATPVGLDLPLRPSAKPAMAIPQASQPRPTLPALTHQALAERFGPPAAVVDRKGAVLYLHGAVEDYLQVAPGEQTGLLADAAREGLRNRMSSALLQAVTENKRVSVVSRVKRDRKSVPVKVTVSPMRHPREADGLLLVTFEEQKLPKAAQPAAEGEAPHSDVRQLEDELKITREELSSTIEQLEQSNEHLKASNEEVTSANEELQSANEELETSKEELQSLNEELNAVNSRLQEKVVELELAGNDVTNLLTSGDTATIFLDRQLRVRRFTPAVTKLLSLVEADAGRLIGDIHRKFHDDGLLLDARRVLVDLLPASAEVQAEDGDWYLRRILPYRTKEDRIEGVVITFSDVTDLKQLADALRCSEQSVRQSEIRYRELVQNANSAIIRWKRDGTVTFFNEYAESFFGYPAAEVIGKHVGFLVPQHDSAGVDLTTLTQEVVADPAKYANNVNENVCRDGRRVWMAWTNKPILDETGRVAEILAVGMDITERRLVEEKARQLATFPEQNPNPVLRVAVAGNVLYANAAGREMLEAMGAAQDGPLPRPLLDLVAEADRAGHIVEAELPDRRGRVFWFGAARPPGEPYVNLYIRDVTSRKAAEEAARRAQDEWERTFDSVPDLIAILDDQHRVVRVNRAMADRLGTTPKQCVGVACYKAVHGMDTHPAFCPHARTIADGREHTAEVHEPRLAGDFLVTTTPLFDAQGKMAGAVHVARDITQQKQAEREREMAMEFLRLVNDAGDTAELVHAAASFFHAKSGCQAVGIRLKEGDDYPYYEARGFPEDFLRAENQLCARNAAGQVARDSAGYPIVECMCGNIIQGRFDPSKPFFTSQGSFWTNCTTGLLASTTEADRQARTRNRCNGEGYESVALVPLRVGQEAMGLLQLNDMRKGLFSPQTIALWERLAGYLAVALAKARAEEALREAKEQLELRVQERTAELTEAMAALRRTSAYTRSLIEASLDPLVTIGPDGTITDVNAATEAATGRAKRALVGTDFSTYFTEPDAARAGYRKVFDEGSVRDYPLEIRHRDGRTISVLYNAALYRDEAGGVVGVFAAARDITERLRAEEALRESELRYRSLFEKMDEGFCVVEMIYDAAGKPVDYRFVEANPAFEKHTGFHDGLGKTIRELVPNHDEHWFEIYGRVARTGEPTRFENPAVAMGREYDVFAFPVGEEANRRVGILFKDITNQKRAEEALREAYETLEQRVAERTAELARSNEELAQFAHVASHDLQEPLRMVSGFLKLLDERYKPQLDDKAREYINYSVEGAVRMSQLITDLLAYSRVGRAAEPFHVADSGAALETALANLGASIRESGATVTHGDLPTVQADETQLMQLLQNLVGNAVKFRSPDRPCQVHVAAEKKPDHWVFSVRDNGIGIDPKQHERVFVIFQRLHTRERYPGTGIGLAICKKIVERHGGRIWVESKIGEGSTFYFSLPHENQA